MKAIKLIFIALALTSCGDLSRSVAGLTGVSKECVDGIQYLQFTSGVTVAYDKDGKVKQCQ